MSKKILVVEDDPRFRRGIIRFFDDRDYSFLEASSVRNALRLIDENPDIRVLLLDLKLSGRSGTELLEELKSKMTDLRVIVLTAHDELLAAELAQSYEVFSYAVKIGTSLRQSLRFQVASAFKDLEQSWLRKKMGAHLEIDRHIVLLGTEDGEVARRELANILDVICERALEIMDAYTCHVRLFDAGRGDFVLWASKGRHGTVEDIFQERIRHNENYSGIVAETRQPLRVDDLQNDPPFQAMLTTALNAQADDKYIEYLKTARSAYVVPISTGIVGNDVDAVFNINSDERDFFVADAKREIVHDFVGQTTLAFTKYLLRKKRLEIHADYKNISEMLQDVSTVLKGDYKLEEIYKIVLRRLSDGLKAEVVSIFLLNETSQKLENVAEFRADVWHHSEERYAPPEALVGRVFTTQQPERVNVGLAVPLDVEIAKALAQERINDIPSGELRHWLAVPVKIGDQMLGVIRAVNKRSEYYTQEEARTSNICLLKAGFSPDCQLELEMAASHLAVAVKNAELFGEVNKRVDRLEAIQAVGISIGSEQDIEALLEKIVSEAAQVMHAEICMLLLANEEGDEITLTQSYGMPLMEDVVYRFGERKTGKVASRGAPILERQADKHYEGKYDDRIISFLRRKHQDSEADIQSFMAVPILGKGKVLGVIKVINKLEPPYQFDNDDLGLFQMFASQIALERFLYKSYSYQKNIVDNSPDPIIFLDADGQVEVFNKACEELWGYSAAEVIGESVVNLYVSEDQAHRIGKLLWQSPDHRVQNLEEEVKTKGGEVIPVTVSAAFLFEDGKRTGSMGVFKDLRELRQLKNQVLRAQREAVVGRFASTMGHHIKHYVGSAQNYIGALLRQSSSADADLYAAYKDIDEALQKAGAKLKELFRVESEAPRKETVRVADLFERVIGSMRSQAAATYVDFVLNCSESEAGHSLSVDIEQIENVLWNLFDNSMDAIKEKQNDGQPDQKGRIEVSVTINNGQLDLHWQDNGCGITPANLPLIFVPFWTDKEDGNGLGLFLLKRDIERHGGQVSVQSKQGEGTSFQLTIPTAGG
jgi:PAS domain S-box-containing protein